MATTSLRIVSADESASWARNLADLCASKDTYDSVMYRVYGPDVHYTHEMLLEDLSNQRARPQHRVQYGILAGALSHLSGRKSSLSYSMPDAYFLLLECDWISQDAIYFEELEGPERAVGRFTDAAQGGGFAACEEAEAELRGRLRAVLTPRSAEDVLLLNRLINRSNLRDAPKDDTGYPAWADSTCSGYLTAPEMRSLASPAEDSFLGLLEQAPAASEEEQASPRKAVHILRLLAEQAEQSGPGSICVAHTE